MSVIMGTRKSTFGDARDKALEYAPNLWAHQRAMRWWNRMNAIDQETAKRFLATCPTGRESRWIASWDLASATTINDLNKEIFNDPTGRTMLKFLATDEGAPYRVPGVKL